MKKITFLLLTFLTLTVSGQDKLTSSVYEYYDGTNWIENSKSEFTYDNSKNLTEQAELYWDSSSSQWIKSYATKYTYNTNNKVTVELYQDYDQNTQYKTTNTYDSNGELIEFISEFWGGTWEFEDKFILEYTNNRLSGAVSYVWNGTDWVLEEESSKITLIYNSNNKVSISESDIWDGTNWVDSDRTVYSFDSNNRITTEDGQIWGEAKWSTDYKSEYTYDANGNAITIKEFYLDNDVLEEGELETVTYDTTQLMSGFSHPFRDKTGLDAVFSVGGIVNKILTRSSVNSRITYYYGNEPTASIIDYSLVGFSVFPNPTTSILNIDDSNFSIKTVELYSVIGKKILSSTVNKLNLQDLVNGVYLLKVETESGKFATKRIIKN
jgi:hypothetical protein